jgi:hemolysin III
VVDHLKQGAERVGERVDAARGAMGERVDAAKEAMGDRVEAAREATAARATAARDAVGERVEAAAEAIAAIKPRLRGVTHEWAFFISLFLGAGLIVAADTPRATLAVSIYAVSLSALFGTSALYHRINWRRPEIRRWMRRLDHTMIFILIAGTTTPFALLVMEGMLADAVLIAVWGGAAAGIVFELIWIEAPKWVSSISYVVVGLGVGLLAFPQMLEQAGIGAAALIAGGGALYATGAIIYAARRPNPNPAVFGYHEIFHLLVIAAAAVHFAAVAFFALPAA